jgi:poly(A) polymerase
MNAAMQIKLPPLLQTPATQKLMAVLNQLRISDEYPQTDKIIAARIQALRAEPMALFVGGCVRNALLGEPIIDIDIATRYQPYEVIDILNEAQIRTIPTGLAHGTITALCQGQSFEITTLRQDVSADGRHAQVAFTDDWLEDAQRRDFTMNALYMDEEGNVFDPLVCGIKDAQAGKLVFVGDPRRRIAEDHLRVLRFFRFYARYGKVKPDEATILACRAGAPLIDQLSKERVTSEFVKILSGPRVSETLELMQSCYLMPRLLDGDLPFNKLDSLINLQDKYGWHDPSARLAIITKLSNQNLNFVVQEFVFPNEIREVLRLIARLDDSVAGVRETKFAIYKNGFEVARQLVMVQWAWAEREALTPDILELLTSWEIPQLPVTGHDVMTAGIAAGPAIGLVLDATETWWIENDYAPDRDSCLQFMDEFIGQDNLVSLTN